MAKVVIAGKSDCAYFAKTELLADDLQENLPDFRCHKISVHPEDWPAFLAETRDRRGWQVPDRSPVIWRELIDRGGKGLLIGGANDFEEYVYQTYGITSTHSTAQLRRVCDENLAYKTQDMQRDAIREASIRPLVVVVTCAGGPIAYSLFNQLLDGSTFGPTTEIELRLCEEDEAHVDVAHGNLLEIQDLGAGLFRRGGVYTDLAQACSGAQVVIILDSIPPGDEEDPILRRHLQLACTKSRFTSIGRVLSTSVGATCRVLVAGMLPTAFATECLVRATQGKVHSHNIAGITKFHEHIAKGLLASKMKSNAGLIEDVLIWGNVGGTTFTEVKRSRTRCCEGTAITGPQWFTRSTIELLHDNKWLETEFQEKLLTRAEDLTTSLHHGPYMLYAASIAETLASWSLGSDTEFMSSLAVWLKEPVYGFQEGGVVAVPVKFFKGSQYQVVTSLQVDDDLAQRLGKIREEMETERELADKMPEAPKEEQEEQPQDFDAEAPEEEAEAAAAPEEHLPVLQEEPAAAAGEEGAPAEAAPEGDPAVEEVPPDTQPEEGEGQPTE